MQKSMKERKTEGNTESRETLKVIKERKFN